MADIAGFKFIIALANNCKNQEVILCLMNLPLPGDRIKMWSRQEFRSPFYFPHSCSLQKPLKIAIQSPDMFNILLSPRFFRRLCFLQHMYSTSALSLVLSNMFCGILGFFPPFKLYEDKMAT